MRSAHTPPEQEGAPRTTVTLGGDAHDLLAALRTSLELAPRKAAPARVWALRLRRGRGASSAASSWTRRLCTELAGAPSSPTIVVLLDGNGEWRHTDQKALQHVCDRLVEHARTVRGVEISVVGISSEHFDAADTARDVLAYLEHPVRLCESVALLSSSVRDGGIRAAVLKEIL